MTQTLAPAPTTVDREPPRRGLATRRRRHRPRRIVASTLLHVALFAGLVVMAVPFVWMILGSFKTTSELRQRPPTWIPESPTSINYQDLWERLDFPRYFFNSALVALLVTVGNLVFCSMLGYALAKLDFPGKRALFVIVCSAMASWPPW